MLPAKTSEPNGAPRSAANRGLYNSSLWSAAHEVLDGSWSARLPSCTRWRCQTNGLRRPRI